MLKNIKLLLGKGFFLIICGVVNAQQNPQYTQYIQNPFVVNPAITGTEEYLDFTVAYRNQWTGFSGAPKTGTFSFNTPLNGVNKNISRSDWRSYSGVGAFLYTDKAGPLEKSGYYASYAYHLRASEKWFISLGTFVGATQFKFDDSDVVLIQNPNDILVKNISTTNFDMSIGIYAYSRYYFLGVSANQLFDKKIPFDVENGIVTKGRLNRNFNFLLGSRIKLNRNTEAVPSILVKAVSGAPIQWEVGTKIVYQDKLWAGVGYRNNDAVYALAGMRFWDRFLVSYSYDYAVSDINSFQTGTHEIILNYRLNLGEKKNSCTRYSL